MKWFGFKYRHPSLYVAIGTFAVMICCAIGVTCLIMPVVLAVVLNAWPWIFSAFIFYPFGVGAITWIANLFD
jgi:hypothetical protein